MTKTTRMSLPVLALAGLAALGAAALAPRAHAQEGGSGAMPGPGPQMMQGGQGTAAEPSRHERRMQRWVERRLMLLDTDGDGKVTAEEIAAEQKRLFAAADVNADGKLSAEEFRRRGRWFVQLRTTSLFDMLDSDGDGAITMEEIDNPSQRWFGRNDADKSGALDTGELGTTRSEHGRHFGRR